MNLPIGRAVCIARAKPRSRGDEPIIYKGKTYVIDKTPLTRG